MSDMRDAGRFEWMARNPTDAMQSMNEAYSYWVKPRGADDYEWGDTLREFVDAHRDPGSSGAAALRARLAAERAR